MCSTQHPRGNSQLHVIPVPGIRCPLLTSMGTCMPIGAYIHSQAHAHKHKIKISKSCKTTTKKREVRSENMLFDGEKSDLFIFSLLNHNVGETQNLVCAQNTCAHSKLFDLHAKKMFFLSIVLKTTFVVMIKSSIKFSRYPFGGSLGLFFDSATPFSVLLPSVKRKRSP